MNLRKGMHWFLEWDHIF